MKIRLCDGCGLEIENKKEYIKCCKSTWNGNKQSLDHVGDLCLECWSKTNGEKDRPKKN